MVREVAHAKSIDAPHRFAERTEAERCEQLARFLRDEEEVVDDMLGLAREFFPKFRVLRRDANRTRIEVAFAHHDAAGRYERCGCEPELLGSE